MSTVFIVVAVLIFIAYSLTMYIMGQMSFDITDIYDDVYRKGFKDGYLTAERGTENLDELFSKYDEVED